MKNSLLLFAALVMSPVLVFSQQDVEKLAANFEFNWNEYLLPNCSFTLYHGEKESYFNDSNGNRVPNHSYLDIKTGGKHHYIVQDNAGFHILDSTLAFVTEKPYEKIELNFGYELELTSEGKTTYYTWFREEGKYGFSDEGELTPPWPPRYKRELNLKLGQVNDKRFKAKRIERLRLGIDMTKTLTTEQKGKNILVKKEGEVVYKNPEKPMLYYDLMITGTKGPHSIYHPSSKDPILENCDRFWCVESFLIVSIKGTPRKHIVSNTGKIVLSSAGEIRYYDYHFGGHRYSFFCDGRSVLNMKGNVIYKSDGELLGVGEHYIYGGNKGGYLGDLSHDIKMNCTNFKRFGELTVGQLGKNSWRLFDSKAIMINEFDDFYYSETDSLLLCLEDDKTIVANPFSGKIYNAYPGTIRANKQFESDDWKFYSTKKDASGKELEGRFDPKKGRVVMPEYRKIEWPESASYYIVLTDEGFIRYLDAEGKPLFD